MAACGSVSIPSYGYLSFLHKTKLDIYLKALLCQFPPTGIFHFYRDEKNYNQIKKAVCQFPPTGIFHFYFYGYDKLWETVGSVNSLLRVSFISTLSQRTKRRTTILLCQFPSTGIFHFYWESALS